MDLKEHESVAHLLRLMEENGRELQASELSCLISALDSMEQQYSAVLVELQDVRRQLDETQTQAPSVRDRLYDTLQAAQEKLEQARDQLSSAKEKIIAWAKGAVEDFKRVGVAALDAAASSLGIQTMLEFMKERTLDSMQVIEASISRMEAIGEELRSAGAHLKNIGRAATGREIRQVDGGQEGRFQAVVLAPVRVARSTLANMNRTIHAAEKAVENLGQSAEQYRGKRERTSLRQQLEQKKAEAPVRPGPDPHKKSFEVQR